MLKICGINSIPNLREIIGLSPDMAGFIFYDKSKRDCTLLGEEVVKIVPPIIDKVGVFVDASMDEILLKTSEYGLQYIQLHGNESPELCDQLKSHGLKIIKAFSIDDHFDFNRTASYDMVDLFLFDTKGKHPGGNGTIFDWKVLTNYTGQTPFLLSGGIGPEHQNLDYTLIHPNCIGIDVNSRFEIEPGLKDINLLKQFIEHD